jgi:hypothetical protein
MELEFSGQIFEKFSNIKFLENPSSGSQFVPYRRTDMTKLIISFHNFAKSAWKRHICPPSMWNWNFGCKYSCRQKSKGFTWYSYDVLYRAWCWTGLFFIPASLVIRTFIVEPPFWKRVWRTVESIRVNVHTQLCEYSVVPRVKILTETVCTWVLLKSSYFAGRNDGWLMYPLLSAPAVKNLGI